MTEPTLRALDLRINAAPVAGFIVWADGEPIAAFTWRHELAAWLLDRLAEIPGEHERESRALAEAAAQPDNVEPFPRVVSPRSEPRRSRFFGG